MAYTQHVLKPGTPKWWNAGILKPGTPEYLNLEGRNTLMLNDRFNIHKIAGKKKKN